MTPEQLKIWNYLVTSAKGISNAITIESIANSIGEAPHGTNNDNVRNWIKDLVVNHGKPIGTCKNGAFIIMDDAEREAAARFVERKNRANSVRNNGNYIPE